VDTELRGALAASDAELFLNADHAVAELVDFLGIPKPSDLFMEFLFRHGDFVANIGQVLFGGNFLSNLAEIFFRSQVLEIILVAMSLRIAKRSSWIAPAKSARVIVFFLRCGSLAIGLSIAGLLIPSNCCAGCIARVTRPLAFRSWLNCSGQI